MKLTSAEVKQALRQFSAQVIPEEHPMVPRLNEMFGEHTFFLDENGLNIVEPAVDAQPAATQTARVVNLANWSDANLTSLAPHEPEATEAVVELAPKH
jgi:hypothetical protein